MNVLTSLTIATAMMDIEVQDYRVDHLGLSIAYRVWGNPAKPVLLLVHGGKDHGRSWDWTVAALSDRYCCVVPDLRGHGDSGWVLGGGYEIFDFVADLAMVVADIKGRGMAGPYGLISHSLGGNIASHYAAAFSADVAALVNIEGLGMTPARYAKWLSESLETKWTQAITKRLALKRGGRRAYTTVEEGASRLAAVHPRLSAEQIHHLACHGLREEPGRGWVWKHDPAISFIMLRPQPPVVFEKICAAIACPMMLLYGRESFFEAPGAGDTRLAALNASTLRVYDDAGHWLHHDRAADFVDDVLQFLKEKWR